MTTTTIHDVHWGAQACILSSHLRSKTFRNSQHPLLYGSEHRTFRCSPSSRVHRAWLKTAAQSHSVQRHVGTLHQGGLPPRLAQLLRLFHLLLWQHGQQVIDFLDGVLG